MKKFNDKRIYFYFAIVTLVIGLLVGAVSLYSILVVEPKVDRLLSSTEDIDRDFREAYRILRDAQIFARYQNFDSESTSLIASIRSFDRKIYTGDEFLATDMRSLEEILERRVKGSTLGMKTMVFMIILSALGWGAFLYERFQVARNG